MKWKVALKRFLLFTFLLEPIIIAVYLPYYLFVIRYTTFQLTTWLLTTIPFSLAVGVVINPIEMFLVRFVDRKIQR